jgi:hypothetical protein
MKESIVVETTDPEAPLVEPAPFTSAQLALSAPLTTVMEKTAWRQSGPVWTNHLGLEVAQCGGTPRREAGKQVSEQRRRRRGVRRRRRRPGLGFGW